MVVAAFNHRVALYHNSPLPIRCWQGLWQNSLIARIPLLVNERGVDRLEASRRGLKQRAESLILDVRNNLLLAGPRPETSVLGGIRLSGWRGSGALELLPRSRPRRRGNHQHPSSTRPKGASPAAKTLQTIIFVRQLVGSHGRKNQHLLLRSSSEAAIKVIRLRHDILQAAG